MSYPIISFSVAFFITLLAVSQSAVPAAQTFKYTNQGEFGPFIIEYDGNYRTLPIATFPFQFCFYNTTPNAFILGLRMASRRSESLFRWVWDANRGNPVKENATLTFGSNGNLVLADADGKVAWQTGTSGKGVVGLSLLPNGNFVLYNATGGYVWQSFDHPTDTLLVDQAFKVNGPTRLVSRLSDKEPVDGPYSFVMEKINWALYYQTKNAKKPLPYYKSDIYGDALPGRRAFNTGYFGVISAVFCFSKTAVYGYRCSVRKRFSGYFVVGPGQKVLVYDWTIH